jgi:PPOX class probable F420-dependent enzyme
MQLDEKAKRLVTGKNFAHLGTVRKGGRPQVTPVWVDYDGKHVLVNTEQKRAKVKNMKRDPRVTLSVLNQENPYEYVTISGRVVEITASGGAEHIDKLAQKYMGQEKYPLNQPGDVRVIVRIEPERVTGYP